MHEGALIGSILAALLRAPLIMDFQGSLSGEMVDHGFLNPQGRFFRWIRRLEKFICHLPAAILTSSIQARRLLVNQFGVSPDKIYPLPDCVDTSSFDPGRFSQEEKLSLRTKLGIPIERPIVAYLGLLAEYQGTSHLIEAAAQLKEANRDAHFLIMGYPGQKHYKILAEQMGVSDRVTITGRIAYPDAPLYLSIGAVAVSPKMSSTEGSGKVLNYMAMGLPTIVYDSPVHREYLADLGLYVSSGNVSALAEKIVETILQSDKQDNIGEKLRQRAAQKYSWTKAGETIVQLYRSLVGPDD
jgi:glycosyltransferase involved in cell wall biosynthesis